MIKYGKTKQFRDVIRDIAHACRYKGTDEVTGEPIYSNENLPTLTFRGSVKLHGTNAGISHKPGSTDITCMSRNNVVSQGHFGFPEMILQEKEDVLKLIQWIRLDPEVREDDIVSVYGEWVGEGVQKGVAISQIPRKTWFIFAIKLTDTEGNGRWLESANQYTTECSRIFNIHEFPTVYLEIDLNNPRIIQNNLIEITNKIEKECPVAKHHAGVSGVGEGAVYEVWFKGHRFNFKVKGLRHAGKSKPKVLKPVDTEREKLKNTIADQITPEWRLAQFLPENLEMSKMGDYLRLIANDILEEEVNLFRENELEWKDVSKQATSIARAYYIERYNDFINLV